MRRVDSAAPPSSACSLRPSQACRVGPQIRGQGLYVCRRRAAALATFLGAGESNFFHLRRRPPKCQPPPLHLGRSAPVPVGRLEVAAAERHPLGRPTPPPAPVHRRRTGIHRQAGSELQACHPALLLLPHQYRRPRRPDPVAVGTLAARERGRVRTRRPARGGKGLAGQWADAPAPAYRSPCPSGCTTTNCSTCWSRRKKFTFRRTSTTRGK